MCLYSSEAVEKEDEHVTQGWGLWSLCSVFRWSSKSLLENTWWIALKQKNTTFVYLPSLKANVYKILAPSYLCSAKTAEHRSHVKTLEWVRRCALRASTSGKVKLHRLHAKLLFWSLPGVSKNGVRMGSICVPIRYGLIYGKNRPNFVNKQSELVI